MSRLLDPLDATAARVLLGLIAVGTAIRLVLAFATVGVDFDIVSLQLVADRMLDAPGSVYETERWPYPGGFLPLAALAELGARVTGLPFHALVQLPAIAADAALAAVVALWLRRSGRSTRFALTAGALVALGPVFVLISGHHGQIDSVAILPAVVGVLIWLRDKPGRAWQAGLLIGLAGAIKTPPVFCLVPLLANVRSRREAVELLAAAAAPLLLATAPWLLADSGTTLTELRSNRGISGFGGISALLQPDRTRYWATLEDPVAVSSLLFDLSRLQPLTVAASVLTVGVVLFLRRAPVLFGVTLLWLVVYVVNVNFAYQYLIWGLPFFLLAGHLRAVAVFQFALVPAALLLYAHVRVGDDGWAYLVAVQCAWLLLVASAVVQARRLWLTAPGARGRLALDRA